MHRALQEPAILLLIFSEISIQDILRIEAVCHLWRAVINSSTALLRRLYLRPSSATLSEDDRPEFNPLLKKTFVWFFEHGRTRMTNPFTSGDHNGGPWTSLDRPQLMNPAAKWRQMLPCSPAPVQLVVHSFLEDCGEVAWLNLSNNTESRGSKVIQASWLTFGLIHDIFERAWFQGLPAFISEADICYGSEFLALDRYHPLPLSFRRHPHMPQSLREMLEPSPGRVVINLHLDHLSEEQRKQQHDIAAEIWRKRRWKRPRNATCGFIPPPPDPTVFTNEFHFEDALSFNDVPWDCRLSYELPGFEDPRPVPQDPPPRRTWKDLSLRWWRRN